MDDFTPYEEFWQYPQIVLILRMRQGCYWHLVDIDQPRMMLNLWKCTRQPPPQRITWLIMSMVLKLRTCATMFAERPFGQFLCLDDPFTWKPEVQRSIHCRNSANEESEQLKDQPSCEDFSCILPHGLECFNLGRMCSGRAIYLCPQTMDYYMSGYPVCLPLLQE